MSLDAISRSAASVANDASEKLFSESSDLLKSNQNTILPRESSSNSTGVEDGSSRNFPLTHDNAYPKPEINSGNDAVHVNPVDDPTGNWLIPDLSKGENPRWGIKGGLQFGFFPGSLDPQHSDGGPRGLIRVWSPLLPDKQYCLANFIAVEPTAVGNPEKGYSELEASQGSGDWKPGKLMTVDPGSVKLETIEPGVQELSMNCDVEKFHNGAHVILEISERSDHPDELHFKVHAAPDSAPIDNCVLTATWGNLTRSREIWLKDGIQNSLEIPSYRNYKGYDFAPDQFYGIDKLTRLPDGSYGAALTTNERHPQTIHPVFGSGAWYWGAGPTTQYWKVPDADNNLNLRVNGRFKYWNSKWAQPDGVEAPGGTTFENFEMREPFKNGQEFVFGVSSKKPDELGFSPKKDAVK